MGDDDGFLAVVIGNRLPLPGRSPTGTDLPVRYLACLVNLEGQFDALLAGAPAPTPSTWLPVKLADVRVDRAQWDHARMGRLTEGVTGDARAGRFGEPGGTGSGSVGSVTPVPMPGPPRPARSSSGRGRRGRYARTPTSTPRWRATSARRRCRDSSSASSWTSTRRFGSRSCCTGASRRTARRRSGHSWRVSTPDCSAPCPTPPTRPTPTHPTHPTHPTRHGLPRPGGCRWRPWRPATSGWRTATRRGDQVRAWYRGPLRTRTRPPTRPDGRLPLAHTGDQLRASSRTAARTSRSRPRSRSAGCSRWPSRRWSPR